MTAEKVLENRLRRVAERRGFRLLKSRRRDPRAVDFNGYMVVDAQTGVALFGINPRGFSASIEEVHDWLEQPPVSEKKREPARKKTAPRRARTRRKA